MSGTSAGVLHGLPDIRLGRIGGEHAPHTAARPRSPGSGTVSPCPTTSVERHPRDDRGPDARRPGRHASSPTCSARRSTRRCSPHHDLGTTSMRPPHSPGRRRSPRPDRSPTCCSPATPTVAVAESVLESKLYVLLDDPRLPPHVRQAPAPWDPTGIETGRRHVPDVRWIVEADGRSWHARVADFERDRRTRPRWPSASAGHLSLHRRRHRPPRLRRRHAARHLRPRSAMCPSAGPVATGATQRPVAMCPVADRWHGATSDRLPDDGALRQPSGGPMATKGRRTLTTAGGAAIACG